MNDNFYAAPGAELEPPRLPGDMGARKANRAARLSATLVDGAIVFGLFVLGAMVVAITGDAGGPPGGTSKPAILVYGLLGLALVVVNIVLLARSGQTLGKWALGIAIVRSNGARCELWRVVVLRILVVRLVGVIPLVGILFTLVDTLMIFGEERRCVHDYMADTIVVHT
jgi:uncharacterized RDD family membrane protein YckC